MSFDFLRLFSPLADWFGYPRKRGTAANRKRRTSHRFVNRIDDHSAIIGEPVWPVAPALWRRRLQRWLYERGLADCPLLLHDRVSVLDSKGCPVEAFVCGYELGRIMTGTEYQSNYIVVEVLWFRKSGGPYTDPQRYYATGYRFILEDLEELVAALESQRRKL